MVLYILYRYYLRFLVFCKGKCTTILRRKNTVNHINHVYHSPGKALERTIAGIIRSTSFLGLYASLFAMGTCTMRNSRKIDDWKNIFTGGTLCGLSLLAEQPSRREEVNIYCLPRIMEMLYHGGVKRGWISYINNGEVILFSSAMGILMYLFQQHPKLLNPFMNKIFMYLFGNN
jgi:hypothetical protein